MSLKDGAKEHCKAPSQYVLQGLKEAIQDLSQDEVCLDRKGNPGLLRHEGGVLTSRPRRDATLDCQTMRTSISCCSYQGMKFTGPSRELKQRAVARPPPLLDSWRGLQATTSSFNCHTTELFKKLPNFRNLKPCSKSPHPILLQPVEQSLKRYMHLGSILIISFSLQLGTQKHG
jgi:hypothetical protein